jgi:hypothetical protein
MTRSEILQRHGIKDHPDLRIRMVQERDTLWLVGINGPGDPIKAISAKKAAELSVELRSIGETSLGSDISMAAQKAQQSNEAAAAK